MRAIVALLLMVLTACGVVQPRAESQPVELAQAAQSPAQQEPVSLAALLSLAADQRLAGEYEAMATTLQQVLDRGPDAASAWRARYGLAEAALLQGRPDEATQRLTALLNEGGDAAWRARALFLLARAHESAGRHAEAIAAYRRYRELQPPLEPYAALRQAAQERALGQHAAAIQTYEHVARQSIATSRRAEALEQLIALYTAGGRADLALARYRDLLSFAERPDYRPSVLLRAAKLAGASDEARVWLREIVSDYPARGEALEAVALLQADAAGGLAPLAAANVYFLHERYSEALPLYDAALAGPLSEAERFEARRRRALCLRALARYDEALVELGALAQQRPIVTITATAQAELDYVQTVGWSGNLPWAIDGYRRFAERFADHELAAEALWRAIQLQQRQGDTQGAMLAALELGRRYPHSQAAHLALEQAGMYFYRSGQREQAIAAWQLLGDGADGWWGAYGHFWAGNALVQAGQAGEAGARFQAAVQAAPQSFYAQRARELLQIPDTGSAPLGSGPSEQERQAVVAWISSWHAPSGGDPAAEVAAAAPVVRARELHALDLRNEARDEWFRAYDQWRDDPLRLWHLALAAHADAQPYVALKAAERILALSPERRITAATPVGLLRLLFPTPYARVVQREAAAFGLDPRLLYALIRQESLFNPDATSWAGARGLGQVMPATGEGIAQHLQVANYTPDLLYRPAVSIRFAAHYLSYQLRAFDQNVLAAAAAYNGGPGNAQRWLQITADRDLFAELIDYRETRDYVKIVYGNWGMYRQLYAGP
ncbi:transglycosylase SLT domain-containing protein [Kallotenue papyrolyticum]|uniref:transglycosylase SLT domain-containing protein n=1 Tax=Kallotenue papyrolyticum TaxID=1325125 RepID=UPI0004928DFD|nr:transglycosylase SLT domain-containing protein [Kallotenue papyrolyticum]